MRTPKGDRSVAAAGKALWANEGFEKLAGVDAVDIVGQDICCLFEEGEGEEGGGREGEGREGEERGELKRSLQLGKVGTSGLGEAAQKMCHVLQKCSRIAITDQYNSGAPLERTTDPALLEDSCPPHISSIAIPTRTPQSRKGIRSGMWILGSKYL